MRCRPFFFRYLDDWALRALQLRARHFGSGGLVLQQTCNNAAPGS
jgi:hypothetical protein